jgi:hypothetical protein
VYVDGRPNGDTPSSGLKIECQGVDTAAESPVGSSTTKPAADAESLPGKVGLFYAACAYSLIKMLRIAVGGDLSGWRGIL